jgi:pilus assembly protein CpaE
VNDVATIPLSAAAHKAPTAAVFVADRDSEGIIRQSFNDLGLPNAEFTSGDVSTAITALAQQPSPRLLTVDIGGVDDPGARIGALAQVCEPGTGVIVIGGKNDIRLYRELKDAGIAEYFFKPLVRNLVTRACNTILSGSEESPTAHTGRLVFFLGVRGGVGATTIAVSTAWHLAETYKRWVMLLDLDLHAGDAALQLDATPTHALTDALMQPDRVDDLFLERGVIHVSPRLDLLASLEPLGQASSVEEDAVLSLLDTLLRRYRFVFLDLPATLAPKLTKMLHLPSTCILVSNGSLAAARDVARWYERIGPNTPERSTVHILNQGGAAGSLPEAEFIRAVGRAPDIIIPYQGEIGTAANLGIEGIQTCANLRRALAPVLRQLAGETGEPARSLFKRLFG